MKNKKAYISDGVILLIIFLIIFLLTFAFIIGVNELIRKSCKENAKIMGLEWKYNLWTDCMIKVGGDYIPIDNYIKNKETN